MGEPDPKWKVYGDLLKHANPDLIDVKAIAEKHQVTPQVIGAYLGALKNSPNIHRELLKAGYEDPVIPGWVARGASEDRRGPDRTLVDQEEAPDKVTLIEETTEVQPGQLQVLGGTYSSRELPAAELQRLGIVKAGDGRYYKATSGTGGSIVLRPVDPSIAVAAAKTGLDVSVAVSEAATEQYKLNVMAIARKVALSPVVYMGHAFAVEQGWTDGDLGDWINHCCRVTLDKIYGHKLAMVNTGQSLMNIMGLDQKEEPEQIVY